MPFFHDQDRSSLRRSYVEAWRKWRERLPMEPLEHQIGSVVEQHPEYHPVLEQDAQALHRDYSPEGGQSNPFLQIYLFETVCAIQLRAQSGDGELVTVAPEIIATATQQTAQVTQNLGADLS